MRSAGGAAMETSWRFREGPPLSARAFAANQRPANETTTALAANPQPESAEASVAALGLTVRHASGCLRLDRKWRGPARTPHLSPSVPLIFL